LGLCTLKDPDPKHTLRPLIAIHRPKARVSRLDALRILHRYLVSSIYNVARTLLYLPPVLILMTWEGLWRRAYLRYPRHDVVIIETCIVARVSVTMSWY